jgi:P pilus assembly chaperone PapD
MQVQKEVSLSVRNPDSSPYLIQTVIDNLESSQQKPPFIITLRFIALMEGKKT